MKYEKIQYENQIRKTKERNEVWNKEKWSINIKYEKGKKEMKYEIRKDEGWNKDGWRMK